MKFKEMWKDIPDYEGFYKISNRGNIKSCLRIIKQLNNGVYCNHFYKERIINTRDNGTGYYQCALHKKGKTKYYFVHRLVAEAFLDKKDFKCMPYEDKNIIDLDKLEINHRDENKQNNNVNNLEYCTHSYNINYGSRNKKMIVKNINNSKLSKKINQYDLDDNFIKTWISMSEAQRQLKIFKQAIYQCCIGKKKTAGGYIWRYADE